MTSKRIKVSAAALAALIIGLGASTFAVNAARGNGLPEGMEKLNLNNFGEAVIIVEEFQFEPGITVKKDFSLENPNGWEMAYALYFKDVEGYLADVVDVTVKDGDEVLLQGKISELTDKDKMDQTLRAGENKKLTMTFKLSEEIGNDAQGTEASFILCANGRFPDPEPEETTPDPGGPPDEPVITVAETPEIPPEETPGLNMPQIIANIAAVPENLLEFISDELIPMAPGEDTPEITGLPEDGIPLTDGGKGRHICCILHLLILLVALIVEICYMRSMKKRQKKIFELRREIEELKNGDIDQQGGIQDV